MLAIHWMEIMIFNEHSFLVNFSFFMKSNNLNVNRLTDSMMSECSNACVS